MASQPFISVLIVNYNGRPHMRDCLDSLRTQDFRDFEIVVVDNASSDGSIEYLREAYPEARLVVSDRNRGFAGGNNFGAAQCRGKWLFLLNNDTRVAPDA